MAVAKNDIIIRDEENYTPSGIKNNNSHYADTGIKLDNNSKVEIVFKLNSLPTSVMSAYIFGEKGTISGSTVSTALYTNRRDEESTDCVFRASIPGSTANIIGTAELNHIYKVVFDYSEKKVTLDGNVSTLVSSLTSWEFPGNAYVFSSNDALAAIKASITLYSMRIYKGGALVRQYKPKQSGTSVGLYDDVSAQLNTGAGSGSFSYVPASGELFKFSNDKLLSIEAQTAVNIVGEELSIDTLSATVLDNAQQGTILVPNDTTGGELKYSGFLTSDGFILATDVRDSISDIVNIKYGTPIYWEVDEELRGKFYAKKVTRIAKNRYKVDAISAIGLLDKIPHQGGVYQHEKFSLLLQDIMAKGVSNRRVPLNYRELAYIQKDNTNSFASEDYASNNMEVVVTITMPSYFTGRMSLFGVANGTYHYSLSVTSTQSPNQYEYGTNLYAEVGNTAYWDGDNHNLPFFTPGSTHRVGFKGYWATDSMNLPYYKLDLFCDGITYEGSIPSTLTFNMQDYEIALLTKNDRGSPINTATGFRIERYESWINGEKYKDILFVQRQDLVGYAFQYNMISNAVPTIPINGYTLGALRPIGDQTPVIPYTIEQNALANLPVSGYLPNGSKRANLYQLLFATNANLVKDTDGSLIFKWLDNNNPDEIIDADIYMQGEVEYPAEVSEVAVTEHTFFGSDGNVQTLFETEENVANKQVFFGNPPIFIPSIEASGGLTLEYATVNYAIVSGVGKLTGCKYLHNETVNSVTNPDAFEGRVVEVKDATLVSSLTSTNVRDRLMQFYKSGIKVKNAIVLNGQTPGKPYTFNNPYNEFVTGILEKLDINVSAISKAEAEFCVGYQPNGSGGIYTHSTVLTESGTFEFPDGVTSAKVVLIGGGDGGTSGMYGTVGGAGQKYDQYGSGLVQYGGQGGAGGAPGQSGKVFSFDLTDRLSHTFQIVIGEGGAGGSRPQYSSQVNPGSVGTATTFKDTTDNTTWTSASGESGVYINPLNSTKYSLPGEQGVTGGDGGSSKGFSTNVQPPPTATIGFGVADDNNNIYQGGFAGYTHIYDTSLPAQGFYNIKFNAGGGCGGGAAVGNNGGNGYDGRPDFIWYEDDATAYGGEGGKGADAIDRTETPGLGQGGHGGHGGGGGGQGGDAWANPSKSSYIALEGDGGQPGQGGAGGTGGNGCIIILY